MSDQTTTILVLHGEDTLSSRNELGKSIATAAAQGKTVTRLEGKKLTAAELVQACTGEELFATDKLIIIEGLLGSLKSKQKDACLAEVAALGVHPPFSIILYETKSIPKTTLSSLPSAQVVEKRPSFGAFAWLDSLKPKLSTIEKQHTLALLTTALSTTEPYLLQALLQKRWWQLVGIKSGKPAIEFGGFQGQKIATQARSWSWSDLNALGERLSQRDLADKTSRPGLPLAEWLAQQTLEL